MYWADRTVATATFRRTSTCSEVDRVKLFRAATLVEHAWISDHSIDWAKVKVLANPHRKLSASGQLGELQHVSTDVVGPSRLSVTPVILGDLLGLLLWLVVPPYMYMHILPSDLPPFLLAFLCCS